MTIHEHASSMPGRSDHDGVPVSGPSGLSDYAVSPLGMPTALLREEVRVAFLGRTSTEEQQDPRQSLIRQLGSSRASIPESWVIVAHFYDVESGRMELDQRGQGDGYERFDIPISRDGGIAALLDEAAHPNRRFDVVLCESISRVARFAYEGLSVERALERAEVPLFSANEPITLSGSRAQRILQRRINQSIAEYEVLNTLELSWGGLCTHVREGWNIGMPPYGYRAKTYRHPNPTKANKGLTKSRLEPDGIRGETVVQIAHWRYYDGLGYGTIAERLNDDLSRYPPPRAPSKARTRGAWSKTSVCDILRNPKYTGYQVFNRRATSSRRGKVNDPVKWVWSPEPVHEPLVPKWMYDELNARSQTNRGSRPENSANNHPATRRTYLLRGMVLCGCGRRMEGGHRHGRPYYRCAPRGNNRGRPDKYGDHDKTVFIREDHLLDGVARFFAARVLGENRHSMLVKQIATIDDTAARARQAEREKLQRILADVVRRQDTILRQAQDGDPDDPFTKGLRGSYNQLEEQKTAALAAIATLDAADQSEPARRPSAEEVGLLDKLPFVQTNLAQAPTKPLRRLFEAAQLTLQLGDDDRVSVTVTLPSDTIPKIAAAARVLGEEASDTASAAATAPQNFVGMQSEPRRRFEPPQTATGGAPDMSQVRALGAIRTRDNGDSTAVTELAQGLVRQLGVDPEDRSTVLDLAAVGVTKLAWRNGPLEDWHADRDREISNADMLRGNVATTRAVRRAVETLPLAPTAGAEPFAGVEQAIVAPNRALPDGRTVADLAATASDLQRFHRHVQACVERWSALASCHGVASALWMLASMSGYEREHWWLAPWWSDVVDEFVRDLDHPKPWLDPDTVRNVPPGVADRASLRLTLREWPDRLDRETAAYCASAGLGHTCAVDPLKRVSRHDYRPIIMVACPSIPESMWREAHRDLLMTARAAMR